MLRGYLVGQQDDELRASLQDAVRDPDVVTACLAQEELRLPSATYLACLSPAGELTVLAGPSGRDGEPPDTEELSADAERGPGGAPDGHGHSGPGNRPTTM